jgi:hypothetical protein
MNFLSIHEFFSTKKGKNMSILEASDPDLQHWAKKSGKVLGLCKNVL